ncbi:unnamed protein product [Mytilus edulis]|uniref:DZIP3-like HEPN domain-containing protein n=1 Tax=Mytilus edulis TaxID=6550 RepID=A0A8S3UX38_MYTED|nr:unnamed protein product [Mytilus edulis]
MYTGIYTGVSPKTHYARLGHASQHILPLFLQQVLLKFEKPEEVYINCSQNKCLSRRLKPGEWARLKNAVQHGYFDFDIPLIYTILRHLHELTLRPTRGWDHPIGPLINEIEIGDDLERCRRLRNEIINRGNTRVSDEELNRYYNEFKLIARRFERFCQKMKMNLSSSWNIYKHAVWTRLRKNKYLKDLEDLQRRGKEKEERILQLEDQLNGVNLY